MNRTQASDQVFGYDVLDSSGTRVGSVDNVWFDNATQQLEFIGVQTGWFGLGKNHLIPVANARVDDASRTIQVPYGEDQIKAAPSYASEADLTAADENNIYSYYGMQRSTAPSPTGLPSTTVTGHDDVRVPLTEEQLRVGKRQVEAGHVRLRKVVWTEQAAVPVELRREELHVERVPASGTEVPSDAFQERDIEVTAMREEPVVSKEAHVSGETSHLDARRLRLHLLGPVHAPLSCTGVPPSGAYGGLTCVPATPHMVRRDLLALRAWAGPPVAGLAHRNPGRAPAARRAGPTAGGGSLVASRLARRGRDLGRRPRCGRLRRPQPLGGAPLY